MYNLSTTAALLNSQQRFCTLKNIPMYISVTVTEDKVGNSTHILFLRAHLRQFRSELIFVLFAGCVF